MKKAVLAALAALTVFTANVSAAPSLSEADASRAKIAANKLVKNKKISFVYSSESDTSEVREDGRTEAQVTAWWLKPYAHLMSEQIEQGRSGRLDFSALDAAGKTYQLRLMLEMRKYDKDALQSSDIAVKQGGRRLDVLTRRYTVLQYAVDEPRFKVGILIDISADEVEENVPVSVSVPGLSKTPVIIPALSNDGNYDSYDTKGHNSFGTKNLEFRWKPLYDHL